MNIYNCENARDKESDRIHAIVTELRKMGATIFERQDGLEVRKSDLCGAELFSHEDHRIAFALGVAALFAKGASVIHGTDSSKKSYASFFEELERALG